ncbi:hypothetical protein [Plantactinospora sp. B5E13]|uniref:hypothetical protein n=1 Tax=unclassified Plantactinospora TaxID=2631981 RepID=UPI00325C5004
MTRSPAGSSGWKTSDRCDTDLILVALGYGIWSRDVRDGQLIHHSDRASNYTSFRCAERLQDDGILPSMGSVGGSFDNALMENFWSTLKIELVYRTSWRTQADNRHMMIINRWARQRGREERIRIIRARIRCASTPKPQVNAAPPGPTCGSQT